MIIYDFWRLLTIIDDCVRIFKIIYDYSRLFTIIYNYCRLFKIFDDYPRLLMISNDYSRLLLIIDDYRRLLTIFDNCVRLFIYFIDISKWVTQYLHMRYIAYAKLITSTFGECTVFTWCNFFHFDKFDCSVISGDFDPKDIVQDLNRLIKFTKGDSSSNALVLR